MEVREGKGGGLMSGIRRKRGRGKEEKKGGEEEKSL